MNALLEFVRFKDIPNWSLSHFSNNHFDFNKNYVVVKLKEVLNKADIEWVTIEDNKKYPILGVHAQGQGVFINRIALGKELAMKKYQKSKAYHLYYCKVRTVKGQWGIVYPEFENSYGSSNMQYLEINLSKLIPEYLELLLKIKKLTNIWDKNAIGADGRHFNLSTLLKLKIPLPPLEVQKEVVRAYQEKMELAEKQELEAKEKEKELEEYLYRELRIETEAKKTNETNETNHLLKFINYKNLDLWSAYLSQSSLENSISSKFPMVKLSALSPISSGGTPSRSKPEYYTNGEIPWVKTGEVRDKIIYDTEEKITKEALKNSSAKLYSKNSLIIAMYGATAGRTAKLDIEASTNQACAVLYDIDTEKVDIDYLWFYLMTQIENFKSLASGSAQPNLNTQKIRNFEIPLPKLALQVQIKNNIQRLKNNIEGLKEKAQKNKELALQEFEKEIFDEA